MINSISLSPLTSISVSGGSVQTNIATDNGKILENHIINEFFTREED